MTPEAITAAIAIFGMCLAFVAGYLLATEDANRRRTWVGLTDEERGEAWSKGRGESEAVCIAIEAKLKEKNT